MYFIYPNSNASRTLHSLLSKHLRNVCPCSSMQTPPESLDLFKYATYEACLLRQDQSVFLRPPLLNGSQQHRARPTYRRIPSAELTKHAKEERKQSILWSGNSCASQPGGVRNECAQQRAISQTFSRMKSACKIALHPYVLSNPREAPNYVRRNGVVA